MPRAPSVKWSWEDRLVALNLYFKLPFGKLHQGNPLIIQVAKKMGRTPSSLAIKLCNFASLDPKLQERGIRGMSGAAEDDRKLWGEFHANLEELAPKSEQLLHDLFTRDEALEVDLMQGDRVSLAAVPIIETESTATVKVRRGQNFFRQAILNAYGIRCCISGIAVPKLLVASHIKPWKGFPGERLNPRNGLCLSKLHDAAFDHGLITLDENFRLVLSKSLKEFFPHPALEVNFVQYEGQPIQMPLQNADPHPEALKFHREEIFLS
jgi:putative restriction endonuclease